MLGKKTLIKYTDFNKMKKNQSRFTILQEVFF